MNVDRPKREPTNREVSKWDVGYLKKDLAAELCRRMGWRWKWWYPIEAAVCIQPLTTEQLADILTALDDKDAEIERLRAGDMNGPKTFDRAYVGRVGRAELKGQPCRVLTTWRGKGKHNVRIEFENGERVICPVRCLRKQNKIK